MFKSFILFVFELIKIVVISLAIIVPIRYFLIQPFYVKGASMEPNFYDKEYLIIDEITYRFNDPQRGDIVVFRYPRNPQEYFIKRLIGLPGETIQIKDGQVHIFNKEHPDGFVLPENYLPEKKETEGDGKKITLGENEFFVLGDNRRASKDSRYFGPFDRSFITGRVIFRGWPFDRLHVFHTPVYKY